MTIYLKAIQKALKAAILTFKANYKEYMEIEKGNKYYSNHRKVKL